jgi:hypothetical protein
MKGDGKSDPPLAPAPSASGWYSWRRMEWVRRDGDLRGVKDLSMVLRSAKRVAKELYGGAQSASQLESNVL